jgi:uncharacterized protein YndB with AHSA1/START domain
MSTPDAELPKVDTPSSVVTECDLPEAPEKVWKALTVPELLARWLPEVLGSEILEARPHELLRYRWPGGKDEVDAAGSAVESVVSFELTGTTQGGTHLRVVHRVVEDARVIPFEGRPQAPVAMAAASSCPKLLAVTRGAARLRRRRRAVGRILLRRAA